ncbi:RING-H2 finger protein ATL80-like [Salvia divinorum]|uniref:RING-H2 finger protein ATL80-like n=1 Tax=Salvia divinorum TaxID=28513 RepID=A0ABD1I0L2_SALDI
MGFGDWFGIGCIIPVCLIAFVVLECCFYQTSSAAPTKQRRAADCAGLTFDTCTGKEEGGDGGCAICLDEYAAGERRATMTECSHRFHAVCIEKWIKINTTCPLCRHNLV